MGLELKRNIKKVDCRKGKKEMSNKNNEEQKRANRAWEEAVIGLHLATQEAARAKKAADEKWDKAEAARSLPTEARMPTAASAWEAVRASRLARAKDRAARAKAKRLRAELDRIVAESDRSGTKRLAAQ